MKRGEEIMDPDPGNWKNKSLINNKSGEALNSSLGVFSIWKPEKQLQ